MQRGDIIMRTITVEGMGHASVKPDFVEVHITLRTSHKGYRIAVDMLEKKFEKLREILANIGIKGDSVMTTDFNISTEYMRITDTYYNEKDVFNEFLCRQNLKLEFDFDPKRVEEVLAALSGCFTHPVFCVKFTLKNRNVLEEKILRSAVQNAKRQAEILCEASGAKLGKLINIDYYWNNERVYSNTQFDMKMPYMPECGYICTMEPENINFVENAKFVWEII